MKRVAWIYHPDYLLHTPPFEHPESPERLVAITDHLGGTGLIDRMVPVTPDYPEDTDILSVHDREYLKRLESACRRGDLTLDSEDTYLNRHSFNIALLSAGGAIAGAKAVAEGTVDRAFCAIRPPGHHAGRDAGMGFCLLNNAAVAARYLQARHGVGKVLIVDWDVHHGNGTEEIFYEDGSVLYCSTHQWPLYPGTGEAADTGRGAGEGLNLNLPFHSGAGRDQIIGALKDKLVPAADRFKPDLVLVSAGFDARQGDPLAGLTLTDEDFAEMTALVLDIARRHAHGRLVSTLEGGYRLDGLAAACTAHVRALADVRE